MGLFILRLAEDGPAIKDGRIHVSSPTNLFVLLSVSEPTQILRAHITFSSVFSESDKYIFVHVIIGGRSDRRDQR